MSPLKKSVAFIYPRRRRYRQQYLVRLKSRKVGGNENVCQRHLRHLLRPFPPQKSMVCFKKIQRSLGCWVQSSDARKKEGGEEIVPRGKVIGPSQSAGDFEVGLQKSYVGFFYLVGLSQSIKNHGESSFHVWSISKRNHFADLPLFLPSKVTVICSMFIYLWAYNFFPHFFLARLNPRGRRCRKSFLLLFVTPFKDFNSNFEQ